MVKKKPHIRIGLIGLGVVGQGVWKHLENNRSALERRLGAKLDLVGASVKNLDKPRDVVIPRNKLTTDSWQLVNNPKIDIICELMGGTDEALKLTLAALKAGKTVVTANKALLCEHGPELFDAANRGGGQYYFEASVGGGIPLIKTLQEGLVANRFKLIYGIINGTCNYILTRMEREGKDFPEILGDARKLGYVEADESLDLDGWDTAHKAAILAFLAHGKWIKPEQMLVEGIREVTLEDIRSAAQLGYKIKLLAMIARDFRKGSISVRVHPVLLRSETLMANVDGVYNGVCIDGDVVGSTLHIGRGAGQDATASSVISDIADAVLALKGSTLRATTDEDPELAKDLSSGLRLAFSEEITGRYYLRLQVKDEPGVLAKITALLAEHKVSISSVIQRPVSGAASASIILTTHQSNEAKMQKVLAQLRRTKSILSKPHLLRIAEFEN
jgi:homoserine dehydrogenase